MPTPTPADLVNLLPERTARQLGADALAPRAVERALVWLQSRSARHGFVIDFDPAEVEDPVENAKRQARASVLFEATLTRAEYQLWAAVERDEVAKDKRKDADDLLEGIVGAGYDPGSDTGAGGQEGARETRSVPTASVVAPARSALSERLRGRQGLV